MSKLIIHPEYGLYEREGHALVSSRDVAETFGKRHDHVLRDIESAIKVMMESNDSDLPKFGEINFLKSTYLDDQRRRYPEYLMTKDGFIYIAMGFTGKRAARLKISYIQRFNEMETFIQSLAAAGMEFPAFTAAILLAHETPKPYHFSNEINMIYRIVLGADAKTIRLERGIAAGESIRPFLSDWEIKAVEALQRADVGMLATIDDFADRKAALANYFERLKNSKLLLTA